MIYILKLNSAVADTLLLTAMPAMLPVGSSSLPVLTVVDRWRLHVQCTNASRDIVSRTLRFIKLHTLMADQVPPSGGQPLFYSKEFSFTKLQVDMVSSYRILYLYSAGMHTHFGFYYVKIFCSLHYTCFISLCAGEADT